MILKEKSNRIHIHETQNKQNDDDEKEDGK